MIPEGAMFSEGATFVDMATIPVVAMLLAAVLVAAWRMVHGPTLADRIVALDMLGVIAIGFTAVAALLAGHLGFLDVGLGVALFGFLGTVAFAAFVERSARMPR